MAHLKPLFRRIRYYHNDHVTVLSCVAASVGMVDVVTLELLSTVVPRY